MKGEITEEQLDLYDKLKYQLDEMYIMGDMVGRDSIKHLVADRECVGRMVRLAQRKRYTVPYPHP